MGRPRPGRPNARKVAQDDARVAYIGEFNSGASAISIPLLNEAGIAQVSPANTAVGLTTDEPGADAGRAGQVLPDRQAQLRARSCPKDTIQGAALATLMKEDGCTKRRHPERQGGLRRGPRRATSRARRRSSGIEVARQRGHRPEGRRTTARWRRRSSRRAPTASFLGGITANGAVQLFKDVAAALPDAKLYGPDGVAEAGFADPKEGGIPARRRRATIQVTVATLSPDEYPPEGKKFFEDFEAEYGEDNPDPYAIYGYEAMNAGARRDASEPATECNDRQAVIEALFSTKDRESVLGTYSIDENGDTTLTDYGVYKIEDGELVFDETIKAAGG